MHSEEQEFDDLSYRRLWMAVILTAIHDLEYAGPQGNEARAFLMSQSEEPRSLRWICFILDIDCRMVQTKCLSKEGRQELVNIFNTPLRDLEPEDQSSLEASSDAFGW